MTTQQIAEERFRQRHEWPTTSWSSHSSFLWDPEEWYQCYVLGKKKTSPELEFGKKVADSMETDKPLAPFTRLSVIEHEFDVMLDGIRIVGSMDTFEPPKLKGHHCRAGEFKTGVKPWTQKRADDHGQLTMYSLLLWLQQKIRPESVDWTLEWAPTVKTEHGDFTVEIAFQQPLKIKPFRTKRTMVQILRFAGEVKKVHAQMLDYVEMKEKESKSFPQSTLA